MANGHVEIHDPFANNNVASSNADPTSQTTDMDDTVEFKLLMVYSQRRRLPRREGGELGSPGQTDTQATENDKEVTEEEKKKKKKKKRRGTKGILKMFSCIKPSVKKDEPSEPDSPASEAVLRCAVVEPVSDDTDELNEVADKLTEIVSEIPFTPPQIEEDTPGDANVEKVVGLLLREAGDKLDQEMEDANIAAELFRNYSFFEKVMRSLLRNMGLMSSDPDHLGPQASPKTQIAVTLEATVRLLTLTSVPQRRMLGYGAQYLHDYFSLWVNQNGGYVEAFHSNDEEEVE